MHYVILRDDDTSAATPIECLERLYRPFLERGLPVNLAVIPNVRTDVLRHDGRREGFLAAINGHCPRTLPITGNVPLVRYLREDPGFEVVQHGYQHLMNEFDACEGYEDVTQEIRACYRHYVVHSLEHGTKLLSEAGFKKPATFVAPYDKFSRIGLEEAARRFPVISTGWFELRRLPVAWWPQYLVRKGTGSPHWRVNGTALLSHPGCLLSCHRPYASILDQVNQAIEQARLTVLVTHWWEYFPKLGPKNDQTPTPDQPFLAVLHEVAALLAARKDTKVVTFSAVARGEVPLT